MKKNPRSHHEEKAGVGEQELIEALERMVRKDYPNPDRIGCPSKKVLKQAATLFTKKVLRQAATSTTRPLRAVLNHIVKCAPCMKEYDRLRKDIKALPRS